MSCKRLIIIFLLISVTYAIRNPFGNRDKPMNHVVGGRDPRSGELKYAVAIHSNGYLCGGGIIDEKFVLTAAHCVYPDDDGNLKPIRIIAGTNVAFGYNKADVIEVNVAAAYLPTVYNNKSLNDDIALLELREKLNFLKYHDKIEKLSLPEPLYTSVFGSKYPSYEYAAVKFGGYGNTRADMRYINGKLEIQRSGAGPLKVASAIIEDARTCDRFFWKADLAKTLCLSVNEDGYRRRKQGTCTGDSGSPAVYKNNVIIGLDSTGIFCDNNEAPTLFTRVSYYIPFIKKAMSGDTRGLVVYRA